LLNLLPNKRLRENGGPHASTGERRLEKAKKGFEFIIHELNELKYDTRLRCLLEIKPPTKIDVELVAPSYTSLEAT
jgi:hypothetical protein